MKPSTGRVAPRHERAPTPAPRRERVAAAPEHAQVDGARRRPPSQEETVQMAGDALVTSMFSGIFLIVATVLFGLVGGTLLKLGGHLGQARGAKIGLALGLGLTLLIVAVLMRRYSERIKLRSLNLYRGIWIGMWMALAVIVVMAYVPQLVFPHYCPPGAPCEFQNMPPPATS